MIVGKSMKIENAVNQLKAIFQQADQAHIEWSSDYNGSWRSHETAFNRDRNIDKIRRKEKETDRLSYWPKH